MERLLEKILDSKYLLNLFRENSRKKKQKSSTKQQNNSFQNLPEKNKINKQPVHEVKMETENEMFEFHVNLDEQEHEVCCGSD